MDLLLYPLMVLSLYLFHNSVVQTTSPQTTSLAILMETTVTTIGPVTEVIMSQATSSGNPGRDPAPTTSSVPQVHQSTSPAGDVASSVGTTSSPSTSTSRTTSPKARPSTTTQSTYVPPEGTTGSSAATTPSVASETIAEGPTETLTATPPTQSTDSSLTMIAFGVMSLILILIIIMVILVTAVNLRGQCSNTKEEGMKYDSVISESNITSNGEKESITLISMRTINTETDTDSPRVSSVHSTILDSEEQELSKDLLNTKLV